MTPSLKDKRTGTDKVGKWTCDKTEDQGFSGVPVRRASFGSRPTTTELTDVSRQNFPDATFAVPSGFEKAPSPFGARGRGQQ